MSVTITTQDVKDYCPAAANVSDDIIQMHINIVSRADACLDANNVDDDTQTYLKLNAVCHLLARNSGNLGVKSESDMDGASVSFETYKIDGYGLSSTVFGQNVLTLGFGCFDFLNEQQNRFMRSFGRKC